MRARIGRREFLAVGAGVVGTSTFFDIRALTLKGSSRRTSRTRSRTPSTSGTRSPTALSGLPDEQVETLIAQLKLNKEFRFLKSDVWGSPDRIRREFFHRA